MTGLGVLAFDSSVAGQRTVAKRSVVTLLQFEIWLLVLVPAGLRISILGAIGTPAILFAGVLAVVWTVAVLTPGQVGVHASTPVRIVGGLFLGSTLVSFGLLHRGAVAGDEASNADRFVLYAVAMIGFALVAAEGPDDRDDVLELTRTFVAAVATMCAIAALQFRGVVDYTELVARLPGLSTYRPLNAVLGRGGLNRPAGTATHPIEFGSVVGLGLAAALYVGAHDRVWSRRWRLAAIALVAFGIPISVSRSALLVALIVLAAFLIDAERHLRRQTCVVLAGFTVVVFVAVPGLLGTLRGYVLGWRSDPSISTRTSDYAAISPYFSARPWFGRGPGTFLPRLRILDNQYLLTAVEMGIVGVVALVCVFGAINVFGATARRWSRSPGDRCLSTMFAAAGAAVVAAAAVFDALSFPMFTMFTMFLLGLSGAWLRVTRDSALLAGADG